MKLITPEGFAGRYFDASSRPSPQLIRRWLRTGRIPGKKVVGKWYIDEQRWLANGDPLVEHILAGA